MVNRERKKGVWHHRAPDFQLVYCGPKKRVPKKETKLTVKGKTIKVSVIAEEDDITDRKTEQSGLKEN